MTHAFNMPVGAGEGPDFEAEAAAVLQRLRTTFAAILSSIPGSVSKPVELQRALNIDINLSCKIFKVISASGSLAAGPHVPGGAALRTFLNAASGKGVRAELISAASEAANDFTGLVTAHAGDRAAFDSMISASACPGDAAQITLQHRRATFRGQRHIFGMQAKVQLMCVVAQPSSDPRMLDLARITGFFSLRQMRPDTPLVISRVWTVNDDGTVRKVQREPLDPTADPASGIALLREFCSQPPPRHRVRQTAAGRVYGELVGNGIGKKSAITCVEGHVARAGVPRYRDASNSTGAINAKIRIPCERLFVDLLVREDTYGPLRPKAFSCAEHLDEVVVPAASEDWQRMEPYEPVTYLGKGPSVLYAADIPRYPELGGYAFERLGWDGERFDVYRCRVEYPVLPSTVVMAFELPEAPEQA
ncbi:MAG TPA: hypothetical protein VMV94_17550 [Phycisphaerae bacterium]|nr:hypothetical protein [Phycisphaerae bacterium]